VSFMNDEKYMQKALLEAKKAYVKGEVPVGAVIVHDDKIIGRGYNKREELNDALAHAEIIAIKRACKRMKNWRLSGATIYVTLEPCPMCAGALVNARIKRLVFGATDPKAGAAGSVMDVVQNDKLNHRMEVTGGVLEDSCRQLLQQFFNDLRQS
jgi:tRNA(adenine34) deaminase